MTTEYEYGFADGMAAQARITRCPDRTTCQNEAMIEELREQLAAVTAKRDELSSLLAANVVVRAAQKLELDGVTAERDALQAKLDDVPMFNPDWSMAPDWAQWWAVDADGDEYWYADKPDLDNVLWIANGICEYIVPPDRQPAWRESLRYRPVTEVTP